MEELDDLKISHNSNFVSLGPGPTGFWYVDPWLSKLKAGYELFRELFTLESCRWGIHGTGHKIGIAAFFIISLYKVGHLNNVNLDFSYSVMSQIVILTRVRKPLLFEQLKS